MKLPYLLLLCCLCYFGKISAQEIRYEYQFMDRSITQNNIELSIKELDAVTAKVPDAHYFIKKARQKNTWNTILATAAAGCIAYPALQEISGHQGTWEVGYVGIGLLAINIPIVLRRETLLQKGIATYNNHLHGASAKPTAHLQLQLQNNQIGICYQF